MVLRKKDVIITNKIVNTLTKEKSKKIGSLILITILGLLILSLVAVKSPIVARGYDVAENHKIKIESEIIFNITEVKAVEVIKIIPEIIPGESATQKEIREKVEAEAAEKLKILAEAKKRNVTRYIKRVYVDPSNFDGIYQSAGIAYGVDPALLKAIHCVETGCSGSTSRANISGATGPMQFLPSTFNRHGVDGNNDGIKDICNVEDAIYSAAAYLKACGYPNLKKALWGYNPSSSYYTKVMNIAQSFGMQV